MKGTRISYRSSLTYPVEDTGAGRKGGRKRKERLYINEDEQQPKKKPVTAAFTEIWHNNEPLILVNTNEVPVDKNKSRCGHCGIEFPRGFLQIVPYDVVISHEERWQYFNRSRTNPAEPKFLPSPHGKTTTKYHCVKRDCIFRRFPYFKCELFQVSETVDLKVGHKVLLREQLDVII